MKNVTFYSVGHISKKGLRKDTAGAMLFFTWQKGTLRRHCRVLLMVCENPPAPGASSCNGVPLIFHKEEIKGAKVHKGLFYMHHFLL